MHAGRVSQAKASVLERREHDGPFSGFVNAPDPPTHVTSSPDPSLLVNPSRHDPFAVLSLDNGALQVSNSHRRRLVVASPHSPDPAPNIESKLLVYACDSYCTRENKMVIHVYVPTNVYRSSYSRAQEDLQIASYVPTVLLSTFLHVQVELLEGAGGFIDCFLPSYLLTFLYVWVELLRGVGGLVDSFLHSYLPTFLHVQVKVATRGRRRTCR